MKNETTFYHVVVKTPRTTRVYIMKTECAPKDPKVMTAAEFETCASRLDKVKVFLVEVSRSGLPEGGFKTILSPQELLATLTRDNAAVRRQLHVESKRGLFANYGCENHRELEVLCAKYRLDLNFIKYAPSLEEPLCETVGQLADYGYSFIQRLRKALKQPTHVRRWE
jgi:hypothetical protein